MTSGKLRAEFDKKKAELGFEGSSNEAYRACPGLSASVTFAVSFGVSFTLTPNVHVLFWGDASRYSLKCRKEQGDSWACGLNGREIEQLDILYQMMEVP